MNKINILMIDDKPFGALRLSINLIKEKYKLLNDLDLEANIPFVSGSTKSSLPLDIYKYFNVFWIRHSLDARQYLAYLYDIKNNIGLEKIFDLKMVPDIVLYDYTLTEGMEYQIKNRLDKRLEEKIIPNIILEQFVETKIELSTIQHIDTGADRYDNEGAYCGGEILNFFNDVVIVGAATTRKQGDKVDKQEVALYEELKRLQRNNTFDIKGEDNLNWPMIIPKVLEKLRYEIEYNVLKGNIRFSFDNVNKILSEIDENTTLITYTRYGVKEYPIMGLFADFQIDERHKEVKEWLNGILKKLIGEGMIKEYEDAVRIQNDLWSTFTSNIFFERVELSEYYLRENTSKKPKLRLTSYEKKRFIELKEKYVSGNEINDEKCKNGDVRKLAKNTTNVRKYIVLFTIVRLLKTWSDKLRDYEENDIGDNVFYSLISKRPDKNDLLLALYPCPKKPLVLPIHQEYFNVGDPYSEMKMKKRSNKERPENIPFSTMYKQIASNVLKEGEGLKIGDDLVPKKGLTNIDKKIVISFANSIGFDEKNINFPVWLK